MSEKKENVPKIRFPGFTDAWEQRELGEVVKVVGGATPSKANKAYWGGDIVWLSSQEIKDRYVSAGTYTITEKAVRETATKVVPAFTPLIVSRSGILARMFPITLPTVDVAINQDIKALFFDSEILDTDFFVSQLEMKENTILTSIVKTGTTVQSVNMPDFEKLIISIPSIQEQQEIGNTFKNLSNLITLHQRKLNNVKSLKAGLLQKMFPKDGEDFPEVRFPGFTDAWEQRELGELANFSKGTGYTKGDLRETGSPIILYGRLYTDYETLIEDVNTFVDLKENSVISLGSEVIVPSSGESAEDIARASVVGKPGVILGGDLNIIKPVEQIDPVFLALAISNGKPNRDMVKRAQGKSVVHLHNSDLKKINLIFPQIEEQRNIVNFHLHFDHLITLHQRKLEHLQEQKKALLQQMFV